MSENDQPIYALIDELRKQAPQKMEKFNKDTRITDSNILLDNITKKSFRLGYLQALYDLELSLLSRK